MLAFERQIRKMAISESCEEAAKAAEGLSVLLGSVPFRRKSEYIETGNDLLMRERKLRILLSRVHEALRAAAGENGVSDSRETVIDRETTYLEVEGGVYHFVLPELRPVYGSFSAWMDTYHRDAVSVLLDELGRDSGYEEFTSRAAIVFVHDIGESVSASRVPDYDNLRTKAIIDAMGMKLITNDNLLSIEVLAFGRRRPEPALNVYVMAAERLPGWLAENQDNCHGEDTEVDIDFA